MWKYEITFAMALSEKELPVDFSFRKGRYREILDEKIQIVNARGKFVANPKKMRILDEKTTNFSLVLLMESQQKLAVPTRGCKALSRELALTDEFANILAGGGPRGKLFVGRDWCEIAAEGEAKEMDLPEIMKVMTTMLLRQNTKDKKILTEIAAATGKILADNGYAKED